MNSATDPLGVLAAPNAPPTTCILSNISSRPALNGQYCQPTEFSGGRYTVLLFDAQDAARQIVHGTAPPSPQLLKVQPSSLSRAGQLDQIKLSAGVAIETLKLYSRHETVLGFGRALTPAPLRGRVTPLQTLGAIALTMGIGALFFGYLIGFTKLLVATSLVGMLLMISAPDWMRGMKEKKPIKHVVQTSVKNLGTRWKEMLIQTTGYNVPDKMAAASLVLMVFWTGKILITRAPKPTMSPVAPMRSSTPKYDLEFIYKLGYEDGKSGDVFGASLPADATTETDTLDGIDLDWDAYNPPPLPRPKPNLGMGTLLSMFALFRFGKELVTHPDGSIIRDPNLIMSKLRSYEPWRLGLIFMSLYRVVGALSSFFR